MQHFIYKNPTEILFGCGTSAEIAGRVPKKGPVLLLVYGSGFIKRNGVCEQVKTALDLGFISTRTSEGRVSGGEGWWHCISSTPDPQHPCLDTFEPRPIKRHL